MKQLFINDVYVKIKTETNEMSEKYKQYFEEKKSYDYVWNKKKTL